MNKKITIVFFLVFAITILLIPPNTFAEGTVEKGSNVQNKEVSSTVNGDKVSDRGEGKQIESEETPPLVRAKVISILADQNKETEYSGGSLKFKSQIVQVKITEGKFKNSLVTAEHSLSSGFNSKHKGIELKVAQEVLLYIEESKDGTVKNAYVAEIARDKYLLYLAIGFVLVLIVIGRLKGLKAVISLVITCFAVVKILLPLILQGFDPVMVSVGVCTLIITVTLLMVSGFNKKTLAAIIGTVGGVLAAGIIAQLVGNMANLTGLGDEESQMLMYIPQNINFDFKGLLFAGIIIGALGAAMDVGMSIASSMHEIKVATPGINRGMLIKSGMNVGRDIMATMSNTLILAYAGGSMQLMLLMMAYNIPFNEIVNRDMIASEVVRSLAGSIGLIFTIPITAVVAGILSEVNVRKNQDSPVDYRF